MFCSILIGAFKNTMQNLVNFNTHALSASLLSAYQLTQSLMLLQLRLQLCARGLPSNLAVNRCERELWTYTENNSLRKLIAVRCANEALRRVASQLRNQTDRKTFAIRTLCRHQAMASETTIWPSSGEWRWSFRLLVGRGSVTCDVRRWQRRQLENNNNKNQKQ